MAARWRLRASLNLSPRHLGDERRSRAGSVSQSVPYSSFAVLNGTISREATAPWTPPSSGISASEPSFLVHDPAFLDLLGPSPSLRVIAQNDSYAFAHEATIFNPETNEVVFVANAGAPLGFSGLNNTNRIFSIDLNAVYANESALVNYTEIVPSRSLENVNGGTPWKGSYLFACQGRGDDLPAELALVSASPPYEATSVINNFFGRQFNSLNDVQEHKPSGAIVFTDTLYGYLQDFRPRPLIPEQVWAFTPSSGRVKAVADSVDHPNGIVFSPDFSKMYIADTGAANGTYDSYLPSAIYSFDVTEDGHGSINVGPRNLFAYIDTGVPDGLKVDKSGNLYAGCGDGVHVFNDAGVLLGKIFIGSTSANLAFVGEGKLVILAETKVWLAELNAGGVDLWN